MGAAVGGLAIAVSFVLALCLVLLRRRPPPPVNPYRWKQSAAEPWGTILLLIFFLGQPMRVVLLAIGLGPFLPVALLGLGCILAYFTGAFSGLREFEVTESCVAWRTLRHKDVVPLAQVVGVSDLRIADSFPMILFADGTEIILPATVEARAVAATLARRLGHGWNVPPEESSIDARRV